MHETSKAVVRRGFDRRYANRWFVGVGIDIGAGQDSLGQYRTLFPHIIDVRAWDLDDGDAQYMRGVEDESYDFVHSSHCLEHMVHPLVAFDNWIRICKPGGHLIITVPDEDLYEQGVFPSTFNSDHKWTFTIFKRRSWSPRSVNVYDLLDDRVEAKKIELLDHNYFYNVAERFDQTLMYTGESAIEFVLKKL